MENETKIVWGKLFFKDLDNCVIRAVETKFDIAVIIKSFLKANNCKEIDFEYSREGFQLVSEEGSGYVLVWAEKSNALWESKSGPEFKNLSVFITDVLILLNHSFVEVEASEDFIKIKKYPLLVVTDNG